jgi:Protein of unknown function (DUF742)
VTPKPRFVRQFALTDGRAESKGIPLTLDTLVRSTSVGQKAAADLTPERRAIISLATDPLAIAEISARLGFHLGIARVLVGDLTDAGYLTTSLATTGDRPDIPTLERLLDDLQAF